MPVNYDDKIKRPFEKEQWSGEMVKEFAKCANRFSYFSETYNKVSSDIYDFKEVIKISNISEVLSYCLWYCLYAETPRAVMITANKGTTARKWLEELKEYYEELPSYLKKGVKFYGKKEVEFDDGTRIQISPSTMDCAKGWCLSLVITEQFEDGQRKEDFYSCLLPTLSCGSKHIIVEQGIEGIQELNFSDIEV